MAHNSFVEFERIHRRQRQELEEMDSKAKTRLYGARKWNQMKRKANRLDARLEMEIEMTGKSRA
jgi:hypothetical protein